MEEDCMTTKKKSRMDKEPCANCGYLYGMHNAEDFSCPGGVDNHGWHHSWMETTFKSKCCGEGEYHKWGCLGYERMKNLGAQLGVGPAEKMTLNDRKTLMRQTLMSKTKEELTNWIMSNSDLQDLEFFFNEN
jgi:hypothetical protein